MTRNPPVDTGRPDRLGERMAAAAAALDLTVPRAEEVRRSAERRRTTRRALGAGALSLVAAALLLGPDTALTAAPPPGPPAGPPSTPDVRPPEVVAPVPAGWGPAVPHLVMGGQPFAGADAWPVDLRVTTLTEVSTGVVYVDAAAGRVVHRGWDDRSTVIGTTPWEDQVGDEETSSPELVGAPWGDHRELVGNPSHDVVTWVEKVGGVRGDLVVVRASTGEELARTAVPGDAGRSVVIASVDDEAVYLATPPHTDRLGDMRGEDVWTWRWSEGELPTDARHVADLVADVSGGVFAVYGSRIEFRDGGGRLLSTTMDTGDRAFFGHMMSPDGRFWRSGMEWFVYETATGERASRPTGEARVAWSGPAELVSLHGGRLTVCTYPAFSCAEPLDVPSAGQPDMPTS